MPSSTPTTCCKPTRARTSISWSARAAASCRARTISPVVTTLLVDAAGPGIVAWPADDGEWVGDPIDAGSVGGAVERVAAGPLQIYVDGAAGVHALPLPCDTGGIVSASRSERMGANLHRVLPALEAADGTRLDGVARAIGAFRLMRGARGDPRPLLICECRGAGSVVWLHCAEQRFQRLCLSRIGDRLCALLTHPALAAAGARDEDDDVAYERGLTLAEDGRDPEADLSRALKRIEARETQASAAGALLAGVLIGHDCARGLRLGRLGGPVALVGAGLPAERYSVALARFGVAVRRIAPVRAMREGCRARTGDAENGV